MLFLRWNWVLKWSSVLVFGLAGGLSTFLALSMFSFVIYLHLYVSKMQESKVPLKWKQYIHLGFISMCLKMIFSFGFCFGNNPCMLTLPMLSFSDFVSNSLALVLAIYPSVSKSLESGLLIHCGCSTYTSQQPKQTSTAEPNVNKSICCTVAKTKELV